MAVWRTAAHQETPGVLESGRSYVQRITRALIASRLAHDHQTVTKVEFSEILQVGVPFCPRPGVDISLQIRELRVEITNFGKR
jgi:hypothetical protein